MTVAIALPTLWLDEETERMVNELEQQLSAYQGENATKADYYDQQRQFQDLGIAIPPALRSMEVVSGWPATCVDVLEERLDLRGWAAPGTDYGLDAVFADNELDIQSGFAHLDALLYGTCFVAVSTGMEGEADPLITIESPTTMTAFSNGRTRRLDAALGVESDNGTVVGATLYLPNETLALNKNGGRWEIADTDDHGLGRVPVAQMINRPRAGDMNGHSEITPGVRYCTDAAMRTLAAAEVAREFHASPQRWVMGAPEKFFQDENGNPRPAWQAYLGRILAIERDESGEVPTVGQFSSGSMAPYWEQIKTLATLLAAESSIPSHYLGFVTDNPTSADAIRQGEARLIKRVERRQLTFGRAWLEVARLAMLVRDGSVPEDFGLVRPEWIAAATPTKAADADRVVKLIQANVLLPDSEVTYDEIGLTQDQQRQLALDKQQAETAALLEAITEQAAQARQQPRVAELTAQPTQAAPPAE